ncbi:MAG: response regulator [Bryobacterales bacterium]|nr:response regulator [Bryobacterales bacterium]
MPSPLPLLGLLAAAALAHGAPSPAAKRVFVLNSYRPGYVWTDGEVRGIHAAFDQDPSVIETRVDFLDRLHLPNADREFLARYRSQYASLHFDLLITTDDDALDFILQNPSCFPNTPVVFGGVSSRRVLDTLPRQRFTGVMEVVADLAMLDLALKLQPQTRRVVLLSSGTATSQYFVDSFTRRAAGAPWTLEVLDSAVAPLPALLARCHRLGPGDLLFVADLHRFRAETQIAAASPVPIFGLTASVGQGFLAGAADKGLHHGRQIGRLALQLLAGASPASVPFVEDNENQFQFDARQMARFKLSHAPLPPNAQILFLRDSFVERHSSWILLGVAFLLLQTVIISGLVINFFQRRKAEHALAAQNQQLAAAAEAKKRFLANMSHELRTPMNAIIGMSGLLLDSPLGSRQREFAETVRNSARSLLAIINDVLELSRFDAGRVRVNLAPFPVQPLLDDLVRSMQTAAAPGVAIRASIPPAFPPYLVSDTDRVRQVLLNFLFNAVKFTSHGHIEISVAPDGPGFFRFSVTDTGIGIPPAQLARVFDRFYQVDDSAARQFGGSGLGLAICREIVLALHGEIGVSSNLNHGSTFWFRIPATAQDQPPPSPEPTPVPPNGLRVLVVEDNAVNLRLARLLLEKLGCQVDTAPSGVQALAALHSSPFDLIFMDVQMPDMDGLEATRQIRCLEGATRRTPIVALTAGVSAQDRSLCLEAGMDDYLAKPVSRDQLALMLSTYAP